jgi:hypothetical protein
MGQLHRRKRKSTKSLARRFGMRETELGELQHRVSKAEARRRFVERHWIRRHAEDEIVRDLIARSTAEIQAIEDARCIASL